jgi:beta-glucosidase
LARTLASVSAALALPSSLASAEPPLHAPDGPSGSLGRSFPVDVLWGSATASYQVEGAADDAGRGLSIWDTFSKTPGKTDHGDTGDVADDFYHRFPQDIALMQSLGLKAFRFSISWTRIFPNGTGAPNPQGMDFYKRLLDAVVAAGMEPFCTLYHWDLPQPLQDLGGWENRDTAQLFADFAGYTVGQLGSQCRHYMTMNEMRTFVEQGYQIGKHAPGLHLDARRMAQVAHHAVLGHGLGVQAIRAHAPAGTLVGNADNPIPTVPVIESPEHIAAARIAMREENAQYLTVMMEGSYTDLYLKRLGADAPRFTAEELAIIASPTDFLGINIYQPSWVRADASAAGYAVVPYPSSYPAMFSDWLKIGPEAIYWGPRLASDLWKIADIYITENGASAHDTIAPDGHVYDTDRVMFLRAYLTQMQRAVADGVPIKGYFLWSLLDNFEWNDGYERRFGITYVDFATQKRTPKLSAEFYRQVIAANRVL